MSPRIAFVLNACLVAIYTQAYYVKKKGGKMIDKIILIICGILFLLLLAVLIWWLKIGKEHFIRKRCPERLNIEKGEKDNGKSEHSGKD